MAEISDFDPVDASNVGRWPEGMLGGTINNAGRADEGILARWFRDTNGSIAASGSSNAFAITSNRTISSLTDGIVMAFRANHSITGAATLTLNGLGPKSIKRFNGNALASGDIVSGQPVTVFYSLSLDQWFMTTAAAALTGQSYADFDENASPGDPAANAGRVYAKDVGGTTYLAYRDSAGTEHVLVSGPEATGALLGILEDNKAQNTAGQSLTGGADNVRELNTEVYDRLGILSLSSNRFTISAAGTYEIEWTAPVHNSNVDGSHQSFLYNQSDSTEVKRGTGGNYVDGDGNSASNFVSTGRAVVTIAAAKAFEIRHRVSSSSMTGGAAANAGTEVYTRVSVRRA